MGARALAAVLTPALGAAVLALPSRLHVGYPGVADALAFAGPRVAAAAGLPLGDVVARGLAARATAA